LPSGNDQKELFSRKGAKTRRKNKQPEKQRHSHAKTQRRKENLKKTKGNLLLVSD
jgi:hypothetical protein